MSAPLDAIPLWGIFVAAIVLGMVSVEGGYLLGRWRHGHVAEEKEAPVGTMVASILGLVAIMLAFTFNVAATRFDARREAVLDEANAIGTTALRARLIPEPERSRVTALLHEYVDVRLRIVQEGAVAEGIRRSEELHEELWSNAVSAAEQNPASVMTALFVQSLNQVIDMHARRVLVGLRSRLPATVWVELFALSLIGMASMGYQAGLSATRRSPAMLLAALAFAGVLFLIVDLDRAHEGTLRVGQGALVDLQKAMQETARRTERFPAGSAR